MWRRCQGHFLDHLRLHRVCELGQDCTLEYRLCTISPTRLICLTLRHGTSSWIDQCLSTVHNNTGYLSLNSSYGNHCEGLGSRRNRDCLHRVCVFECFYLVGWFHGFR